MSLNGLNLGALWVVSMCVMYAPIFPCVCVYVDQCEQCVLCTSGSQLRCMHGTLNVLQSLHAFKVNEGAFVNAAAAAASSRGRAQAGSWQGSC
jgi:hypothetical protein